MVTIRRSLVGVGLCMLRLSLVVGFAALTGSSALAVDEGIHASKFVPSDGIGNDQAGNAVAIQGNFAVVGAANAWRSSLTSYDPRGAAYLYRNDGGAWSQVQKLVASDANLGDRFGWDVAMSSDTIFVGAPYDDNERGSDAGSVYVYRTAGSTWYQSQRLFASDGLGGDTFGSSISTNGSFLFVAATGNDQAGTNAGAVYVFRFNGSSWVQSQKLLPTDTSNFGYPVAAAGNFAIVGSSSNTNANGSQAGAAYAYRYNGSSWVYMQKILASDGVANQNFGNSVAVSDPIAIIGARLDSEQGNMAGAAYVFRYNTATQLWDEEDKLVDTGPQAPYGQPGNQFGYTVGISGSTAVVAAPWWDDQETAFPLQDQGAAFVYAYNSTVQSWILQKRVVAADGYAFDNLGKSIAISGNSVIAGSPMSDAQAMNSGAGYVFATGCLSSAGCDDDNPCTNDVCNSNGTCSNTAKANGTTCPDDGNFCTSDVCTSGTCTHPAKPNGTTCADDGNQCTSDVCSSGSCTHPNKAAGSACGNSSATLCDNPDTCNGSGVCLSNSLPTGTACQDDGNQCTRDYCVSGSCVHPNTPNGWVCNDGNSSTINDQCVSGVCQGTPTTAGCTSNNDCEDGNPCTTDVCNSGTCQQTNNSNACSDDGNDCTNDVCSGGVCTHPQKTNGSACQADTNACTYDYCISGVCTHPLKPAGSACGNSSSSLCDNPDTCNSSGVCVSNNLPNGTGCADDGNECTSDYCNAGLCVHPVKPTGSACTDDGNSCTYDYCSSSTCIHPNKPLGSACGNSGATLCDDPDSCNGSGVCLSNNLPNGTACSGGVCQSGQCLSGCASNADCNDGNPCTNDSCNTSTRQCGYTFNFNPCSDDGNACTSDVCSNGACTHPAKANGTLCNDGLFCTAVDRCSAGICVGSGDPCSGPDGDSNCSESCNEWTDDCSARDPDDSICSDGNPNTVGDFCYAGSCIPGQYPSCNERNQSCLENWECCSGSCNTRSRKCR